MSIQVSTTQYEFAHGKKPKGYGLWFFELINFTAGRPHSYFEFTGTYTAAKKEAVKMARTVGASKVIVGS